MKFSQIASNSDKMRFRLATALLTLLAIANVRGEPNQNADAAKIHAPTYSPGEANAYTLNRYIISHSIANMTVGGQKISIPAKDGDSMVVLDVVSDPQQCLNPEEFTPAKGNVNAGNHGCLKWGVIAQIVVHPDPSSDFVGKCFCTSAENLKPQQKIVFDEAGVIVVEKPQSTDQVESLSPIVPLGVQVKTNHGVRVRKGPGTKFPPAGSLANGTEVHATHSKGDWTKIQSNPEGWIMTKYWDAVPPPLASPVPVPAPVAPTAPPAASLFNRPVLLDIPGAGKLPTLTQINDLVDDPTHQAGDEPEVDDDAKTEAEAPAAQPSTPTIASGSWLDKMLSTLKKNACGKAAIIKGDSELMRRLRRCAYSDPCRCSIYRCSQFAQLALIAGGVPAAAIKGHANNPNIKKGLEEHGFTQCPNVKDPYKAPVGAVIFYDTLFNTDEKVRTRWAAKMKGNKDPTPSWGDKGAPYGHIEIRTPTGFGSDYLSPNARTKVGKNPKVWLSEDGSILNANQLATLTKKGSKSELAKYKAHSNRNLTAVYVKDPVKCPAGTI